jgi:ABC-type multidrug transport system fused ATPase/permease subunit
MLVFFVAQGHANKGMRGAVMTYITLNDRRIGALRDLLYNVKSVKALAYEPVFQHMISSVRKDQLKALRTWMVLTFGYFTAVNQSIPALTAAAAFLAYYLSGHELTAPVVFPALAYFNMLYAPVSQASLAFSRQYATWPSAVRILKLMRADEVDSEESTKIPPGDLGKDSITFKDASFVYPGKSGDNSTNSTALQVSSLSIPSGQLTAVIGPTGSGKSSLLQAALGEMIRTSGNLNVYGSIAYSSQEAWIMSGTLRDNIVFASDYDAERYHRVVRMCGLEYDFRSIPGGDLAQVGESGNTLSGGQRARVSLARCLYSDADIYLLDDPFSAVDAKVGALLFETLRSLSQTVVVGKLCILRLIVDKIKLIDNSNTAHILCSKS